MKKMKNKKDHAKSFAFRRAGFTLFELLVSISIIAILTALATISFSNAQKKARDTKRIQDVDAVKKALEMYYSNNNYSYPTTEDGLEDLTSDPVYLEKVPTDPKGGDYAYTYVGGDTFCFCAEMEDENKGNAADNACDWEGTGFYCAKNQQ
jgi:general secretion pathway protein G